MKRQKGLTLLEMLVVMVLVSLLSTLLLQGGGTMLQLYQRVLEAQRNNETNALPNWWFQKTLSHLNPSFEKHFSLRATEQTIEGYTLSPLLAPAGVLTSFRWRLAQGKNGINQLFYKEFGREEWLALEWVGGNAKFRFRDYKGRFVNYWPIEETEFYRLPILIELMFENNESHVFSARMHNHLTPLPDFRDQL